MPSDGRARRRARSCSPTRHAPRRHDAGPSTPPSIAAGTFVARCWTATATASNRPNAADSSPSSPVASCWSSRGPVTSPTRDPVRVNLEIGASRHAETSAFRRIELAPHRLPAVLAGTALVPAVVHRVACSRPCVESRSAIAAGSPSNRWSPAPTATPPRGSCAAGATDAGCDLPGTPVSRSTSAHGQARRASSRCAPPAPRSSDGSPAPAPLPRARPPRRRPRRTGADRARTTRARHPRPASGDDAAGGMTVASLRCRWRGRWPFRCRRA